jgi:hypothetical protein
LRKSVIITLKAWSYKGIVTTSPGNQYSYGLFFQELHERIHSMNITSIKAKCKTINLLDEEFYNNLLKLHEADHNSK